MQTAFSALRPSGSSLPEHGNASGPAWSGHWVYFEAHFQMISQKYDMWLVGAPGQDARGRAALTGDRVRAPVRLVRVLEWETRVCAAVQDMDERLSTDMEAAARAVRHSRVLTIHGSADDTIPVSDASEFARCIRNHTLHVVEGADHGFSEEVHATEAVEQAVKFFLDGCPSQ